MTLNKVREMAKRMNLDPGSRDKKELIRFIQEQEGNIPCFKTSQPSCDQYDCCWRSDCKPGEMAALS
jgi:hypothetical protein